MTQQDATEQVAGSNRRRRQTRPFPMSTFEDVIVLPRSILEHGVNGEIQRLTLLGKTNRSPSSGTTRALITNSSKYGLTAGGYSALLLKVTDDGQMVSDYQRTQEVIEKEFQLAISRFDSFDKLYGKLKGERLPDEAVLGDELEGFGIPNADRLKVARVFTANIRYLELIQNIQGVDHVRSEVPKIDHLTPVDSTEIMSAEAPTADVPTAAQSPNSLAEGAVKPNDPSVHIDIQIHIDSSATSEQIDQLFESMARHLYRREG